MKLLTKTSLKQFWLSLCILVLTGVFLLMFLHYETSAEVEEQLDLQIAMVSDEIAAGRDINYPSVNITQLEPGDDPPRVFKDTLIYDRLQDEEEGYYYLKETKLIAGKKYQIKVMASHIGLDGYSKAIGYIFLVMAVLFMSLGSLMNYFISRTIWAPFIANLQRLKSYSVSSNADLNLDPSDITEFREMNIALKELAYKARNEYTALREFTENASHEIQTPLSIIQSRLESINQMDIQPELGRYLEDAKQATSRLSRVNKGLLLLAKLENNDFPDRQELNLQDIINSQLAQVDDLFLNKGLIVDKHLHNKNVYASLFLLESLISNLLSNVLTYANPDTTVTIILNEQFLSISNQGEPLSFPVSKLFTRFGKGIDDYKGNGLGLSIVKQICLANEWDIEYAYEERTHMFKVRF